MEFVRRLIAEQELGPGDRLPSEVEIAAMAGVSLMTVRRAMSELGATGTLQRIQGKGTFVRSTRIHAESTIMGGLKQTLALQGMSLRTMVMSFVEEPADQDMAARLSIPPGAAVWRIVRVRFVDGRRAVREVAVIPRILAPDLDARFTQADQSLYEVLARDFGLNETNEEQTLIARLATPTEASDLELGAGSFVVELTGVSGSSSGTAFDSFTMVFVPGLFAFRLRSAPMADPVVL